jgi:hypothetical protein
MGERAIHPSEVLKFDECYDALGNTVDINGVSGSMEVSRRSVLKEEMIPVEFEPSADGGVKFCRPTVFADPPQCN